MLRRALILGFCGVALALPALAQGAPPAGPPARVRGTVVKLDGQMLTVKERDGKDVMVMLAPNVNVRTLERKHLSDIKDGDYVASTGRPGKDGKLHAVEVRIFPETMRGVGEGQFPWDLKQGDMMTNATVSGVSKAPHGRVLTVTYKGQSSSYEVGPKTPILAYGEGDVAMLKRGKAVFIIAKKEASGDLSTATVTVEANGIKPPM